MTCCGINYLIRQRKLIKPKEMWAAEIGGSLANGGGREVRERVGKVEREGWGVRGRE